MGARELMIDQPANRLRANGLAEAWPQFTPRRINVEPLYGTGFMRGLMFCLLVALPFWLATIIALVLLTSG